MSSGIGPPSKSMLQYGRVSVIDLLRFPIHRAPAMPDRMQIDCVLEGPRTIGEAEAHLLVVSVLAPELVALAFVADLLFDGHQDTRFCFHGYRGVCLASKLAVAHLSICARQGHLRFEQL